jgi:pyruvate formate lyase activating enzyme
MNIPPIKGFVENTLIDWEGKIASIIFLAGCNFRCHYCHARHLVLAPNTLETIPFEAVRGHLASNNGWIDGVVITGGEPCIEANVENLIDRLRELNLIIKLDTNGSRPEVLKGLVKRRKVDAVSMDIKAPLEKGKYEEVAGAGVDLESVTESLSFLSSLPPALEVEFRTTVCPAFLNEKDVVEIARSIRGAERFVLQEFKPLNCLNERMLEVEPYTLPEMEQILQSVRKHVPGAYIRGYKDR